MRDEIGGADAPEKVRWNDIRRVGPLLMAVLAAVMMLSPSFANDASAVGAVGDDCREVVVGFAGDPCKPRPRPCIDDVVVGGLPGPCRPGPCDGPRFDARLSSADMRRRGGPCGPPVCEIPVSSFGGPGDSAALHGGPCGPSCGPKFVFSPGCGDPCESGFIPAMYCNPCLGGPVSGLIGGIAPPKPGDDDCCIEAEVMVGVAFVPPICDEEPDTGSGDGEGAEGEEEEEEEEPAPTVRRRPRVPFVPPSPILGPTAEGSITTMVDGTTVTFDFPSILTQFVENAVVVYGPSGATFYEGPLGADGTITIPGAGSGPFTIVTMLSTGARYTEVVGTLTATG